MSLQMNCIACDQLPGEISLQNSVLSSKMFQEVTGLKIKQHYTICKACQLELRTCYNFRHRCHEVFNLYNSDLNMDHSDPLSGHRASLIKKEPVCMLQESDDEFWNYNNDFEQETDGTESLDKNLKKRRLEDLNQSSFKAIQSTSSQNSDTRKRLEKVERKLDMILGLMHTRAMTNVQRENSPSNEEPFVAEPIKNVETFNEIEASLSIYRKSPKSTSPEFQAWYQSAVSYYSRRIKNDKGDPKNGLMKSLLMLYFDEEMLQKMGWSDSQNRIPFNKADGHLTFFMDIIHNNTIGTYSDLNDIGTAVRTFFKRFHSTLGRASNSNNNSSNQQVQLQHPIFDSL